MKRTQPEDVKRSIVPALPGWYLIDKFTNEPILWKTPIVAWVVEYEDQTDAERAPWGIPVTLEMWRWDEHVMLTPDGKYFSPFDRNFRDEQDVIDYLMEEEKKKAAERGNC